MGVLIGASAFESQVPSRQMYLQLINDSTFKNAFYLCTTLRHELNIEKSKVIIF